MAVPIQAVALSRARRQGGPVEGVVAAEDLLGRARDGDLGAVAQFYDEEAGQLLGWFKHRTAAADVAADL